MSGAMNHVNIAFAQPTCGYSAVAWLLSDLLSGKS